MGADKLSYLQLYAKKTGDKVVDHRNFKRNTHGFSSWYMKDGKIYVSQCCGDGPYWLDYFTEVAREMGKNCFYFWTARNPKAWVRKYKFTLLESSDSKHLLKVDC